MNDTRNIMIAVLTMLAVTLPLTALGAKEKRAANKAKEYIYRFTLTDKQNNGHSLNHPGRWLSAKAIERRKRQHLAMDSTDLPVSQRYVRALHVKGTTLVGTSRWNNTVLLRLRDTLLLKELRALSFVKRTELVWLTPDSAKERSLPIRVHDGFNAWDSIKGVVYGNAKEQIEMLSGQRLHNIGLRGKGMTIAVLDGGFQNALQIQALQEVRIEGVRDFVNPTYAEGSYDDVMNAEMMRSTDHGTKVLSVMGTNSPEVLVGTAPEARYWLLRCEDIATEQPVEEDYWAMAAEFADSVGVDIINSSLGYTEYDAPHKGYRLADLDGNTALISRTASMLARKGIILVNSAGNSGMSPWKKLCVPADAHEILTVGAIGTDGKSAPFSSVGPAQDGRVKPDVVALGAPAALISGRGTVLRDMGTSFATPVVCGLMACLWQSMRQKSALEMINLIRESSNNYRTPDNVYGYGLPNFWRAYMIGKLE